PDHPQLSRIRSTLGITLWYQGDAFEAAQILGPHLEQMEQRFGPTHPKVGIAAANLAGVRVSAGQLDAAAGLYERAMMIEDLRYGDDDPRRARAMIGLGNVRREQGRLDAARRLHHRALVIRRAARPEGHLEVGIALRELAETERRAGDATKALPRILRAEAIFEQTLGVPHIRIARARAVRARVLLALERPHQAHAVALAAVAAVPADEVDPSEEIEVRLALVATQIATAQTRAAASSLAALQSRLAARHPMDAGLAAQAEVLALALHRPEQ
nr:tetratricopeptide repeat protein [Deltaproteobacteria bacterium]